MIDRIKAIKESFLHAKESDFARDYGHAKEILGPKVYIY